LDSSAILVREVNFPKDEGMQPFRLCSLELISQNQQAMKQYFSLTTNQYHHQHQPKKQPAEQSL
jgi:hypothetical protein